MKNQFLIYLFLATASLFGQPMKNNIIPIPQKFTITNDSKNFVIPKT
ncbi:MAG: hypothetical protein H6613_15950 [Ignavibacteriales bacterium]|nr:hypothetical protein [Ignavibacteriales bacterium]